MITKICTDIDQSKKLAEILPPKSNDLWWNYYSVTIDNTTPQIIPIDEPWVGSFNWENKSDNVPCWSLSALLEIYPMIVGKDMDMYCCWCNKHHLASRHYNNPIDACYEMILKLHEKKLL